MKYPTKLSDAVHILCFIALAEDGQPLTSAAIAKSIATNASYVRQLMGLLRRGELLTSVRGHARPALTRPPSEINLLDCYRAVEGEKRRREHTAGAARLLRPGASARRRRNAAYQSR